MEDWSSQLYNGLVTAHGMPNKVASQMITKPNRDKQISEPFAPSPEIVTDNGRNRHLGRQSKQRFSVHRSLSFLPQE